MKHIYSSIDIGTDTIKLVVCELYNSRLNLLAASSVKSRGIKKGLIVDPELATISIRQAFDDVESMLGVRIKKVIANIPSYFAEYTVVKGSIEIENEEQIITGDDVVKLLNKVMEEKTLEDREMVNILPIDFTANGKTVKDPKGLKAKELSVRAVLATAPAKSVYSVVGILNNMGIDIVDISFGSVGDIYTFGNSEWNSKVGCILNIGHETTTISLYNKGIVVKSSIICMGSKNITNDLSYMYKIDEKEATRLKERFALAHKKYANANEYFELEKEDYNQKFKVNQLEVSQIVMARIGEILELANKEINSLTSHKIEYIIITGGISNMPHLEYCLKDYFKDIACIGNVKTMGIRNNKYSVALGNIVYYVNKLSLKGTTGSMIDSKSSEQISSVDKGINISSDSMIGKVFGYFFGQ